MIRRLRAAKASLWVLASASMMALATLPAHAQEAARDRGSKAVVAEGDPALTRGMVARIVDFFEWVVEAPLTTGQRAKIEAGLVDAWQKHNKSDIEGAAEILKADEQVAPLSEDQRALVLRQVQPEILKSLRSDPKDEFNQWLLAIYDSAHAEIAPGKPPLTRQISDAQAEMFAFMLSEAVGQTVNADPQFKDDWAKWLKGAYPGLPAERQTQWAQSPVVWASLRVIWAKASEADRAKLRKEWAGALQGMMPQVKGRAELEAGLKDLAKLAELRKSRALTPAEMERGATDMDNVARSLRKTGAEGASEQAAQVEKSAAELRRQASEEKEAARQAATRPARPAGSSTSRTGSKSRTAELFAKIQAQHSAYMSMSNLSMQTYYSHINSINTLGGSSYRYVNAYGNPY